MSSPRTVPKRRSRSENETIVALSSPPGKGPRAIVRLSGPQAIGAVSAIFRADDGTPIERLPTFRAVRGVLAVDAFVAPVPCLVYLMRAPRSYTREDVVELHVPGNPAVTSTVIAEIIPRGVRLARPGEFTERAFLSGRIDLAQAEAVLKIIHARGESERRAAVGELSGELSARVGRLDARLLELLTQVELALDFCEDDLPVIAAGQLHEGLAGVIEGVDALLAEGTANVVFRELPRVSLIGRSNVGKSSLFNRLLGRRRAIVTPAEGTTRDVLEEELHLPFEGNPKSETRNPKQARNPNEANRQTGSIRILLVDTAGEKPAEEDVDVEALRRAREELQRCDLPVLVLDGSAPLGPVDRMLLEGLRERSTLIVCNKIDLGLDEDVRLLCQGRLDCPCPASPVHVSCLTGEGMDPLRREIVEALSRRADAGSARAFLLNLRQQSALVSAREALVRADAATRDGIGLEFPAADMRCALNRLRELTHPLDPDEVLDRIFSRFCIGK